MSAQEFAFLLCEALGIFGTVSVVFFIIVGDAPKHSTRSRDEATQMLDGDAE